MKHSIAYCISIQGQSKQFLLQQIDNQVTKLNIKFGEGKGAVKERLKLEQRRQEILNH